MLILGEFFKTQSDRNIHQNTPKFFQKFFSAELPHSKCVSKISIFYIKNGVF